MGRGFRFLRGFGGGVLGWGRWEGKEKAKAKGRGWEGMCSGWG